MKNLLHTNENMSLDPQNLCEKLGMVMYTYDFSTGEAKTRGSPGFAGQLVLLAD